MSLSVSGHYCGFLSVWVHCGPHNLSLVCFDSNKPSFIILDRNALFFTILNMHFVYFSKLGFVNTVYFSLPSFILQTGTAINVGFWHDVRSYLSVHQICVHAV